MLNTLVEDLKHVPEKLRQAPELLKEAPERLKEAPERLKAAPQQLKEKGEAAVRAARHQVHLARGEGQERLWELETNALGRAEELLARGKDVPVVSKAVPAAERLVHKALETVTRVPVEGWDALNARDAAHAVRGLNRIDLLRVRRHEQETKDRKTVYRAIDAELERLKAEPAA